MAAKIGVLARDKMLDTFFGALETRRAQFVSDYSAAGDIVGALNRAGETVVGVDLASGPDRKDVAAGMEQRLTVCGSELDAWGAACEVPRKAGETDAEYRPRVLRGFFREMSSPLGLQAATAGEQTRAKVLAELTREGTTRSPEMRATPDPWRVTMEVFDKCGALLACGVVDVARVSHDRARVTGEIKMVCTGTAAAWRLRGKGGRVAIGGPVSTSRGSNTLALNSVAFCSGGDVVGITLDVYGGADEMRALFGEPLCAATHPHRGIACEEPRSHSGHHRAAINGAGGEVRWSGMPVRKGPSPLAPIGGTERVSCQSCGVEPQQHHAPTCPAGKRNEALLRRAREAPLVALVNTVPDGLDATGWRAAVLAVHECVSRYGGSINGGSLAAGLIAAMSDGMDDADAGTPFAAGYHAYQRALAPHKAPPPERRQGGKALRLTVDDGRDE